MTGGEGPWIRGLQFVKPGVLILGTNAVNTDTVATAVMGYDPRAARGTAPFAHCDNTLMLAEGLGVGTTDLSRIEVVGTPVKEALIQLSGRRLGHCGSRTSAPPRYVQPAMRPWHLWVEDVG